MQKGLEDGKDEAIIKPVEADLAVSTVPADTVDVIPDGGYGWICVLCAATVNAFVWGVAASYGVYLAYYLSENTFRGGSPLNFALVGGLNFAMAMVCAPIATLVARICGTRLTMALGTTLHALGFVLASFSASRIWVLYLTQGVLIGVGISFIFVPNAAILPQWFSKRRTLAQGLSSCGAGIGGVIFSLATTAMIKNINLQWSLRITGIVCFVCNMTATYFVRDRNASVKPSQLGFATYLLKRKIVVMLLCHAFFNMLGYMTVLYSLSAYAGSLGLSQQQGSTITALLNLGTFVGRPLLGLASDRYGRIIVAGSISLFNGIICFVVWIPCNSYGVLIFFALLSGASIGAFWMTIAPLAAEVAGIKEVASLLSLCWLSIVLPTAFAEVIALYIRRPDSSMPYLYPQIFAGLAYIICSLFLAEIWRLKRKTRMDTA